MLEGWLRRGKRTPLTNEQSEKAVADLKAQFPEIAQKEAEWAKKQKEQKEDRLRGEAEAENYMRDSDKAVIAQLKDPIEKIVTELAIELENGEYSTIIGDDASGRIPAIMIGVIAKRISEQKGTQPPIVRFIAGSTGLSNLTSGAQDTKTQALADQMLRIKDTVVRSGRSAGKVLIVTDTVARGESVNALITALRESEWDADVATVGVPAHIDIETATKRVNARLVVGDNTTPDIYAYKRITGVEKSNTEIFAHAHPEMDVEQVRRGRKYAKEIAEEIFRKYTDGGL